MPTMKITKTVVRSTSVTIESTTNKVVNDIANNVPNEVREMIDSIDIFADPAAILEFVEEHTKTSIFRFFD
jgi:predicted CoA-binding protein